MCTYEITERRRILPKYFIQQYYKAREVVNQLEQLYGNPITLGLLVKNVDGLDHSYIENSHCIDDYIPEKYIKEEIKEITRLS